MLKKENNRSMIKKKKIKRYKLMIKMLSHCPVEIALWMIGTSVRQN